jgi:adenylate cyclase
VALSLDDLTDQKSREAQLDELRRYVPGALMDNILTLDDVNVSGQERTITMISTDVRGFTTFSENLQPEQLMEVINQYLSLASDGINLYEGIVDKYMGDAVTGIFNTQLNPQDDHAIRAVRAAMSIIYDLYALHEIMPEDQRLFYGIGIHTGPAFLGNVGGQNRKEFSALGEAATISKILESNAGRGEVIISEDTYQLVKDAFECEPRKPDKTKGFDDKLKTVYKVVKQKRGAHTGALFLDPELAEMLKDLED